MFVDEGNMSGIINVYPFETDLFPLSIASLTFIQAVAYIGSSFLSLPEQSSIACTLAGCTAHSLRDTGLFQILSISDKAALNIHVQIFE